MNAKERQSKRIEQLTALGLIFDGSSFVYEDINFHHTDTLCMSDRAFEKALEGATKRKAQIDSEKE